MSKKKVLFIATVDSHILNFHLPYLQWFRENGWETHVATSGNATISNCDIHHVIQISRNPFKIRNIRAYSQLKQILNKNNFSIIHAHTPMGGVVGRLASCKFRKRGLKVFYTAHGFHFFRGVSVLNWIIYFSIEWVLSFITDVLIVINEEDYTYARKYLHSKETYYTHGIGFDSDRFDKTYSNAEKLSVRKMLGCGADDWIMIYVAELTHRKHQDLLINLIPKLFSKIKNIRLLLVGDGDMYKYYKSLSNNKCSDRIIFTGKRTDIPVLMQCANVYVASSRQEGLPLNIMEAMASGLPIIATDVRGHRDLIKTGENGFLVPIDDTARFIEAIIMLHENDALAVQMANAGREAVKPYAIKNMINEVTEIYRA